MDSMATQGTLLKLMCLPPSVFSGVCRTSDGYYLAQVCGDLGYNYFLGRPAPPHEGPGKTQMLKVWTSLSLQEQQEVHMLAQHPMDGYPILLHEDFGVPLPPLNTPL